MNKDEFIKCFAHFITETDLNAAFSSHFEEYGHMNELQVVENLKKILDNNWTLTCKELPVLEDNYHSEDFLVTINGFKDSTVLGFDGVNWFDDYDNKYNVVAWQRMPKGYE